MNTINAELCNINDLFDDLTAYFDTYKQKIDREHLTLYFKKTFNAKLYQIQTDKAKLKQIFGELNRKCTQIHRTRYGSMRLQTIGQ